MVAKAVSIDNIPSSNSRKFIEISFKLIGSSKSKISAQKDQVEFGLEMSKIKQLIRDWIKSRNNYLIIFYNNSWENTFDI